ncbi:MAG: alpha 1,2 mannosyltransferase [Phylliscum demangeonii]|nr:MAG: alpha 1,2 mannosyltransferase [Phylliscum demangeonii]
MLRRLYLFFVAVRLYFALCPSYLHPDENFQGPEVIAGRIFQYPVHLTWEFTGPHPIRSVYPLWPVYGMPMLLLQWVWFGSSQHPDITPAVVYWTLRVLMFVLSFVLEDWAIHELVHSPGHRRLVLLLVASSYVTWTFQTHTFSNSIETLLVAWCLVLIERIVDGKHRRSALASAVLGFLLVFGVFNRITFPAFLIIPSLRLIPHFRSRPFSFLAACFAGALSVMIGVSVDTAFYTAGPVHLMDLIRRPVITPLHNLRYNSNVTHLAAHGLHPWYQHLLLNLPQLLGPAYLLLYTLTKITLPLVSAVSGVLILSCVPHQEARFLIPVVPLILCSVRLPRASLKVWMATWILFNALLGIFMGVYHQGGVVPTQNFLAARDDVQQVFWWKTYSPPTWLLGGKNAQVQTTVLMGTPAPEMVADLMRAAPCISSRAAVRGAAIVLVAPRSSTFLDAHDRTTIARGALRLEKVWEYRHHINLDDLDVGQDGLWSTWRRVVGQRGLITWRVRRYCDTPFLASASAL